MSQHAAGIPQDGATLPEPLIATEVALQQALSAAASAGDVTRIIRQWAGTEWTLVNTLMRHARVLDDMHVLFCLTQPLDVGLFVDAPALTNVQRSWLLERAVRQVNDGSISAGARRFAGNLAAALMQRASQAAADLRDTDAAVAAGRAELFAIATEGKSASRQRTMRQIAALRSYVKAVQEIPDVQQQMLVAHFHAGHGAQILLGSAHLSGVNAGALLVSSDRTFRGQRSASPSVEMATARATTNRRLRALHETTDAYQQRVLAQSEFASGIVATFARARLRDGSPELSMLVRCAPVAIASPAWTIMCALFPSGAEAILQEMPVRVGSLLSAEQLGRIAAEGVDPLVPCAPSAALRQAIVTAASNTRDVTGSVWQPRLDHAALDGLIGGCFAAPPDARVLLNTDTAAWAHVQAVWERTGTASGWLHELFEQSKVAFAGSNGLLHNRTRMTCEVARTVTADAMFTLWAERSPALFDEMAHIDTARRTREAAITLAFPRPTRRRWIGGSSR